jgi:D-beta-D-heptose 7-phosphate kinase/D-beta-D-heptose 1-phosphate adenosyltransferase
MFQDFSAIQVAVMGDLMLDRYIEGSASRLSPEAPVAVVLCSHDREVVGGAGNVAANLTALAAKVALIGVIGDDPDGGRIEGLLRDVECFENSGLVVESGRPTTSKTRVISARHQMIRLDREHCSFLSPATEDALISNVRAALPQSDVFVISDYAKGVCSNRVLQETIAAAAALQKPVVVDPKRRDFSVYRGATLIKPNRQELELAVGFQCEFDADIERAARILIDLTGAAILVTRSEEGMSYFAAGAEAVHLPTKAQDVFDVTGAGDTVLAIVALGLSTGAPVAEVLRLANLAAGVVVKKVGTAVVTMADLDAATRHDEYRRNPEECDPLKLGHAVWQRQEWRRMGLKVGFTNGCFDLLHPGHVRLLREAAENCDRLIVGINTDASVKRLKGADRPIQDQHARAAVLGALRSVDLVLLFDEDTPARVIEALQPDLLVKGADYREDEVVGSDIVKSAGGRVMLVPLMAGKSTTSIIGRASDLSVREQREISGTRANEA